ncbi:hypothetical protein L596_000545 [Steinernema carpocapsae]|uniref:Uncharacterized protein n=1 Tax=Steinernema carpocapsae TaxID=34508 RepID=A0A4U8UIE2_STECR|nr:hypothetical protein L596_000545 [Steinernema carpocapsae]
MKLSVQPVTCKPTSVSKCTSGHKESRPNRQAELHTSALREMIIGRRILDMRTFFVGLCARWVHAITLY